MILQKKDKGIFFGSNLATFSLVRPISEFSIKTNINFCLFMIFYLQTNKSEKSSELISRKRQKDQFYAHFRNACPNFGPTR